MRSLCCFVLALLLWLLTACSGSSFIVVPTPPTQNPLDCDRAHYHLLQIDPDHSSASYQVMTQFFTSETPTPEMGTTMSIQGSVEICTNNPPIVRIPQIQVDLRTLQSDSARLDEAIRENWLQSNKYPYATFTSTTMFAGPATFIDGKTVAFQLLGKLTIHGTTNLQAFAVQGTYSGGTLTGTATTMLTMKDYGFDPPSVADVLTVIDGVTVTFAFTAR